ncbi:uncharacterized protein LOC143836693 [Paroedura picta]|uniref:uncharacterized protein LOC143836693 n=1 Tax=Paroedura picta TaxID=143630 RepID=UPI0040578570
MMEMAALTVVAQTLKAHSQVRIPPFPAERMVERAALMAIAQTPKAHSQDSSIPGGKEGGDGSPDSDSPGSKGPFPGFEDQLKGGIPGLIRKQEAQALLRNFAGALSEGAQGGKEHFLRVLQDKNGVFQNINQGRGLSLHKSPDWVGGRNVMGTVPATPGETAAQGGGYGQGFFGNLAQGRGLFGRRLLLGPLRGRRDLNDVSSTTTSLGGDDQVGKTSTPRAGSAEDARILERADRISDPLPAALAGFLQLASEHADLVHSLPGSITKVEVVEISPPVIRREVAQGVWKSQFRVTLKGQSARYGDFTSTANVEAAVRVLLSHSASEGVTFRVVEPNTSITKIESKFEPRNGPPSTNKAVDLLLQVVLMDMVARVYPDVIRTINAKCLSSVRELVPLRSEGQQTQFLPGGPATFTEDALLFPYATLVQREDGRRTMLGGVLPPLPPLRAAKVDVAVSPSVPLALLAMSSPGNLSAMVWGDGALSAEERSQMPEAPEQGVLKAKFVEAKGPWISDAASPADTRMLLVVQVSTESEGKPNQDLATLKLETHLKTTFEASGSKLIAKLSLDRPDDLLISSPVAGTPVDRYRKWSEGVIRKIVDALNRKYQERGLALSTLQRMSKPAVTVSQGLLHIHETA